MERTVIRAIAALVLISGVLATAGSGAMTPVPVTENAGVIKSAQIPQGLSKQPVTVIVEFAGAPVAVKQGQAGRRLSRAEKDAIKGNLKKAQDGVRGRIEGLGGHVLANYQVAYNGTKVRITRDKLSQLRALPGVVAVRPVHVYKPTNVHSIPFIGAPTVWGNLGLHGEGVKIAVIDTGIDYTHANFGGPGTVDAFTLAQSTSTLPADPKLFGPGAPRVKGGTDLVGDDYDAEPTDSTYQPIPHPDPNPLDCNGHGSHVAGTAAGSGVTAAGETYTGSYDATTVSGNSWTIGPGVAPKADIYSVRVFGCAGSTDVVTDAIEWAIDHDMDVINMSLGSDYGGANDPDVVAANNAVLAGIVVVASAGNAGPNPYLVGNPSAADGVISVAANDSTATFPGATIVLSNDVTMTALNSNGYAYTSPLTFKVKVIEDNPATDDDESLGCSVDAFGGPLPPNTIAVVNRGICARVAKAIFGQQAGAAAVVMVNNAPGLPPYEGTITSNPDDGIDFLVTIPFLGVGGPPDDDTSDGAKLRLADGLSSTVTGTLIPNPEYTAFASFSSGGPASPDSFLKPDITAPGVSISSTLVGSGNQATLDSGTSMASPHVAGVAALTRQANPSWSALDIKAAILNTGLPSGVADYVTSLGGTGLVQPAKSTASSVIARASDGPLAISLNFGFQELAADFSQKKTILLTNNGTAPATFNVAEAIPGGSPHTVTFSKTSLTVGAKSTGTVDVTLNVPVGTVGDSNDSDGFSLREVSGIVQFTPATSSDNAGVTLSVPYYFVPRALSNVSTVIGKLSSRIPSTTATVSNTGGPIAGNADFYAWGIADTADPSAGAVDIRAVGTQSFPWDDTTQLLVFAVNTYQRWTNPAANEFDIYVDVDGDGVTDYIVVGADQGLVETGFNNGVMGSYVYSTRSDGASTNFFATAPTNSSTAELPVLSSQLCRDGEPCLSAANPRITYQIAGFNNQNGVVNAPTGVGLYNVWSSAISQGGFVNVLPGATDSSTVISLDFTEWRFTPARGLMIVTLDNAGGAGEAQLITVNP